MTDKESVEIKKMPEELLLLTSSDLVVFPEILAPIIVKNENHIKIINEVLTDDSKTLIVALEKTSDKEQENDNLNIHPIGCVANIVKMMRIPDGTMRVLIQGVHRVRITDVQMTKAKLPLGKFEIINTEIPTSPKLTKRIEALVRSVKELFTVIIDAANYLPEEMKVALMNISNPGILADFTAANISIQIEQRQEILSSLDVIERLEKILLFLRREEDILKIGSKIQSEVTQKMEKNQREYYLREQLRAIRKELGDDEEGADIIEVRKRVEELDAPTYVKEAAEKEVERLGRINPASSEYSVSRSYIEWLLDLPWNIATEDSINIEESKKILDRDHYGLDDVKKRIIEYLAVKKLGGSSRGSILCFIGPPGVGKTSIGKSIAEAMGRSFVRMSLGGLRDEAEIRGHRRTYIGALPGRIMQNIRKAKSNNPVFMLDEIDKLGTDFRGDPASAMLEVLDPEQNFAFQDNYIELDFDLSKVMFITTANYMETIPPPLRDRMEVIKLPGYVTPEKVQIAKRYLVPRQMKENGLTTKHITFSDGALEDIVIHYTREAGVRNLERVVGKICRKVAVQVASGNQEKVRISVKNLKKFLGPIWLMPDLYNRKPTVGVANGLAWTSVGGVMLVIETIIFPGDGKIKVTGQLGNVMKESAEIARSYLQKEAKRLNIPEDMFKKYDLHIHVPEGATPKDGPSAGITIITALASLFTNTPVRHDVAMTGEITLQGRVLPIGGLREKAVAAGRSHMKMVICPKANEADLEGIPSAIKEKVEFKFVQSIDEVLKIALHKE